jgi:hypothetical protein
MTSFDLSVAQSSTRPIWRDTPGADNTIARICFSGKNLHGGQDNT